MNNEKTDKQNNEQITNGPSSMKHVPIDPHSNQINQILITECFQSVKCSTNSDENNDTVFLHISIVLTKSECACFFSLFQKFEITKFPMNRFSFHVSDMRCLFLRLFLFSVFIQQRLNMNEVDIYCSAVHSSERQTIDIVAFD